MGPSYKLYDITSQAYLNVKQITFLKEKVLFVFTEFNGCHVACSDRFFLLPFTGYIDSENQKVYDGDILEYGDNYLCIVYWDEDNFQWSLIEMYEEDYNRYHELNYLTCKMKKIGNVFKNKKIIIEQFKKKNHKKVEKDINDFIEEIWSSDEK